jgi:hypothetical protein
MHCLHTCTTIVAILLDTLIHERLPFTQSLLCTHFFRFKVIDMYIGFLGSKAPLLEKGRRILSALFPFFLYACHQVGGGKKRYK